MHAVYGWVTTAAMGAKCEHMPYDGRVTGHTQITGMLIEAVLWQM